VTEDEIIAAIETRLAEGSPADAQQSAFAAGVGTMGLGGLLGSLGSITRDLKRLLQDPLNPSAEVAARAGAFGTLMSRTAQTELPQSATPEVVAAAEATLGVRFPPLLARLYLEVGNGGFGPGFGILGLPPGGWTDDKGTNLVDLWQRYRDLPDDWPVGRWRWPATLLPIAYYGDVVYACLDTSEPGCPVLDYDPSDLDWDEDDYPVGEEDCFERTADTLAEWLTDWLEG
jgi:hypothetical protein